MKGYIAVERLCGHISHVHARRPINRKSMKATICEECSKVDLHSPREGKPTTRVTYYQLVVSMLDANELRGIRNTIIQATGIIPSMVKLLEVEYVDGSETSTVIQ